MELCRNSEFQKLTYRHQGSCIYSCTNLPNIQLSPNYVIKIDWQLRELCYLSPYYLKSSNILNFSKKWLSALLLLFRSADVGILLCTNHTNPGMNKIKIQVMLTSHLYLFCQGILWQIFAGRQASGINQILRFLHSFFIKDSLIDL